MITIPPTENDNSSFIKNIETIIKSTIKKWNPQDLYITRIDNWFDDKWLGFAGTVMHEISIHNTITITIPPFHPNRVESRIYYQQKNGIFIVEERQHSLHIIQGSENNLKRMITDISEDGLFFWYSGNSKSNTRGSLMWYYVKGDTCLTYYLTLSEERNWKSHKILGLKKKEIDSIL